MAEQKEPRPIAQVSSQPGIQRDGTTLDANGFVDGQWVRFYRRRARKMNGFRSIVEDLTNIPRGINVYSRSNSNLIYLFASNGARVVQVDNDVVGAISFDVSPTAFVADDNFQWQTDRVFDATGGGENIIVAHPAKNLNDISNQDDTPLYYSPAGSVTTAFDLIDDGIGGTVDVSGGVVVLQPYVFAYGHDGFIRNSNQNKPNDWQIGVGKDANEVNVAGTKIVKGLPMRGGGQSPSGLFWALDSLIKVSYVGGAGVFRYDPVGATTVMSSSGMVELDGYFFWMGVDRFYVYDGRVTELPNQFNINWVFDNLNFDQRQKVWATKVPRWGEIWWFFPFGQNQVECNVAVIYNVREKIWYDCAIERGCGYPSEVLRFPIWCGTQTNSSDQYVAYAHEAGYNQVEAGQEVAIQSYIETHDFGYPTGGADGEKPTGQDYFTRLTRVEPDFVQTGDMTLTVIGNEFAQDQSPKETSYTFGSTATKIDMREQRRMIRLRFESNEVDGFYEMGRVILHTEPGDIRS